MNINKPKTVGTFTLGSGKLIVEMDSIHSYAPEKVVESLLVFYGEKKPSGKWPIQIWKTH